MSSHGPISQLTETHKALRESKILGDLGLGTTVGVVVAIMMYSVGASEPVIGVPAWLVFGGGAAAAVSMLSASLGIMPDAD